MDGLIGDVAIIMSPTLGLYNNLLTNNNYPSINVGCMEFPSA